MSTELTYEQMPLWMRRSQQHFDWGIVFALLIGLLAAWPFLHHAQLSMTNGQLHDAFRTADTAAMLREGRLYPRWSPHAFSGYGAPIPNYVAPGTPYIAAVIEVLFTDDTLTALRIAYTFSLMAAAAGVYLLVTRWSGCTQGLLATTLYVLSPYIGLTLPHLSGNLALMCSAALLPFTLWTFDRLLHDESPFEMLYVGLLVALQILIEPQILLAALPLCLLILITTLRTHRLPRQVMLRVLIAWLCGAGLAAMFWLPMLAETAMVEWRSQPVAPPLQPVMLRQLFQPMNAIDPLQLKPNPPMTVGIPLWIMVLIAAVFAIIRRIRLTAPFQIALVLMLIWVGWLALIDPGAHWLLLPITLCAAVLGSAVINVTALLPPVFWRTLPPLIVAMLLMLAHPIWLAPAPVLTITDVTPAAQVRYEQLTGRSALLPSTAQIPTTLPQNITSNPLLVNSYGFTSARSFDTLSKIVPPQLIRNGQLNLLWQHTHESLFRIPDDQSRINLDRQDRSRAALSFTWLTAYFPGWEARLDGSSMNIEPDAATHLIRVELPAGSSGALLLQLNETPVRRAAWITAGLALVILLLATRYALRQNQPEQRISPIRYMRAAELRLFGVLSVCFVMVFGLLNFSPYGSMLRTTGGSDLQAAEPIRLQTSVGLQLFGYQTELASTSSARRGQRLELDLYWRVLRSVPENYWVRLSLTPVSVEAATAALILAQKMPGDLPTRLWPTERYIRDRYVMQVPEAAPYGLYVIGMEIFACDTSICDTTTPGSQIALFTEESRTPLLRFDLPRLIDIQP